MPQMSGTEVQVSVTLNPNTTFEETVAVAEKVNDAMREYDEFETVGVTVGNSAGLLGIAGTSGINNGAGALTAYGVLKDEYNKKGAEISKELEHELEDIDGEVTPERVRLLRTADSIFRRLLKENGQARKLSGFFSTLEPAPGGYAVALHALTASETGLSRAARIPYDLLESAVEQIQAACPAIVRVAYELTTNNSL